MIVNNDGTEPVSGAFSGLPQDATFNLGPYPFKISYIGKTGNDITLTSLSGDPFNHAPVAVDDAYGATMNTLLTVPARGARQRLRLRPESDHRGSGGRRLHPGRNRERGRERGFTYNPPTNFTGTDTFSYIISDGLDATDMATVTITVLDPSGVGDSAAQIPRQFELLAPHPNPSRDHVEITFGLPAPGQMRAEVFDAAGRRVARLANDETFTAGIPRSPLGRAGWLRRSGGDRSLLRASQRRLADRSRTEVRKLVMLSQR